jgi:uncharacterized membrane protein
VANFVAQRERASEGFTDTQPLLLFAGLVIVDDLLCIVDDLLCIVDDLLCIVALTIWMMLYCCCALLFGAAC